MTVRLGSGQAAAEREPSPPSKSVYEQVLGRDVERLHPQLRRYFGPIPAGQEGRGRGVYSWAGPRHTSLRPVFAWLASRRVLFPERGRDVPFAIVNRPCGDGALSATREFSFPRVTRVMEDTMEVTTGPDGKPRLVDRLGRRRGLEVELELRVHEGGLRMRSTRLWLRMRVPAVRVRLGSLRASTDGVPTDAVPGGAVPAGAVPAGAVLRVPLPRVVTMTLDERAHPADDGRQCVDVRLRSPLLGDVFRYVGEFDYGIVPVPAPEPEPEPLPKPEQLSSSGDSGGFPGASA